MLVADQDDEEDKASRIMTSRGLVPHFRLGISISLDELAIGFSLGWCSARHRRPGRHRRAGLPGRATGLGGRCQGCRRTVAEAWRARRGDRLDPARRLPDRPAAHPMSEAASFGLSWRRSGQLRATGISSSRVIPSWQAPSSAVTKTRCIVIRRGIAQTRDKKGGAEHVREVHRPVAARRGPGPGRGQDAQPQSNRHRAPPARPHP